MYQITDNVLKDSVYSALAAKTRVFCQRLSFGEGTGENFSKHISFEKGITKIEISQEGNSDSNGLVLGSCCASSCVAEFYNPDKSYNYNGRTLFVECGVKIADGSFFYIPCGYYKVDKPETDDDWKSVKITAYDAVDDMTDQWNTSTTFPSNAYTLLYLIASKHNLELDIENSLLEEMQSRTVTEDEALTLTAYTEREVCGFLAGLFGANARINTVGKLAVKRYQYSPTDDFNIPADVQWQNGFKKTAEEEFIINSVTSGIDDVVFTAGTGTGISFANPIIKEDEITAIYEMYAGISFQPSNCEWRGNPCIECGDTVTVTDRNDNSYTLLVASQDIDLTGGLSINSHCPGGDAEISFDTLDERIRAQLNKQYTELQEAIKAATDAITQTQGSIFELIPIDENDTSKGNSGWKLRSQITNNVIIANSTGIGFSSDGGKTFGAAAIYIDESGEGHINACYITTGFIQGKDKSTYFDLDNSVIGTIKRTSSNEYPYYSFEYSGGGVAGKYVTSKDSETMVGGFLPYNQVMLNSTETPTGFYGWFSDSLTIFQSETGSLDNVNHYVSFHSNKIDISKPIESVKDITIFDLSGNLQTGVSLSTTGFVKSVSSEFSAHTHYRYDAENFIYGLMKSGIGKRTVTSTLAFSDYANANTASKEKNGYTYYARTGLSSTSTVYRLTNWMDAGDTNQLNVSFNGASYGWAYFHLAYKKAGSDSIYTNTSEGSDLLLALVENDDTAISKTVTIPSDAVSWAIVVTPHTGNENYWAGWRNITVKSLSIRPTASLELWDYSGENMQTRLDIAKTDGEAMGIIRLQNGFSQSANLELGTNNMWFKGYPIYSTLVDLEERVAALESA